jgi:pimeloyl-ACP methyl ester carboxylesterase
VDFMNARLLAAALLVVPLLATGLPTPAQGAASIGVVVMHGKGGRPDGLVRKLAEGLESRGYRVANLDMPWSGRRQYDTDVAGAEREVDDALAKLRSAGATKLFVAGHSQGAVFALHYATRHPLDGLVIIAPGGNVGTRFYQGKVGASVSRARELVASGKGGEREGFDDFEGGSGTTTVHTTAAIYLTWFDRDGAMNQMKSSSALPAALPVLHVAPTDDYPALQRAKREMFGALPANPLTKLYEPATSHREAPTASLEEIARWTAEVAVRK